MILATGVVVPISTGADMKDVGVVAVGRNEGERFKRCLGSLIGRHLTVVYVDSASTDGSPEYAREMGVDVIGLDMSIPFTVARARRAGFDRLLTINPGLRYVQFVDGDCEVNEHWLGLARAELDSRPDVAAVCGRRRERYPDRSPYNRLADLEWDGPPGEIDACGGDAMMRIETLRAVGGGYNPAVIVGEEAELCLRLRAAGMKIVRLAAEMTVHDIDMMRFGQWWKRTVRTGYGFAEGMARHGASEERHMVREHRSVIFWGLLLPLIALALAWPTRGLSLALLIAYPLLYIRIVRRQSKANRSPRDARLYALSCVVGKFPQAIGLCRFWVRKWLGMHGGLIEYKDGGQALPGSAHAS